jgi:SAM-dependent methyltransferase
MPDTVKEFDASFARVRDPKKRGWIVYEAGAEDRIVHRLRQLGVEVRHYDIDVADYRRYFSQARYQEAYPNYYSFNLPEKSLEHYVAAHLLRLGPQDIYIDIASEHSPAPEIYHRLFGAKTYRQDLAYAPGLHGDRMGGDAAHLPVPDAFATKMALHCSFEHFEGDSDVGFIREVARVLKLGGAVCFVPLYLYEEYAIQTDPAVAMAAEVSWEADAIVYCAPGWNNRHGRFYDPEHLANRIVKNLGSLTLTLYRITNAQQVDATCYARFAMLVEKPRLS